MTKVYVEYSESYTTVRDADPSDNWDQGDQDAGGQYVGVSLSRPGWYHKEFDLPVQVGDTVYVVWCTYTEGCTFGHTSGKFDAMVCIDYKDIDALKEQLKCKHDDYFGGVDALYTEVVELTDEAPENEDD